MSVSPRVFKEPRRTVRTILKLWDFFFFNSHRLTYDIPMFCLKTSSILVYNSFIDNMVYNIKCLYLLFGSRFIVRHNILVFRRRPIAEPWKYTYIRVHTNYNIPICVLLKWTEAWFCSGIFFNFFFFSIKTRLTRSTGCIPHHTIGIAVAVKYKKNTTVYSIYYNNIEILTIPLHIIQYNNTIAWNI